MAQIGFTAKTEPVYDRFNKMRLAYAEKHGRTYAPDFLTVLMDGWEELERISKEDVPVFTDGGIVMGSVNTGFTDKYFD